MSILESARNAAKKENKKTTKYTAENVMLQKAQQKSATKTTSTQSGTTKKNSANVEEKVRKPQSTSIIESAYKAAEKEHKSRTTTRSALKPSNNALIEAKNKASIKTTITSNLSEKERKARIKEINNELSNLSRARSGLSRAGLYGDVSKQIAENEAKQSQLSKELKELERVGTFTASELKQFEIEDAKAKKAALPNYNPTARITPSQVNSFVENVKAHSALNKEIDTLEREKAEYKYFERLNELNAHTTKISSKSDFEQNSKYTPVKPKTAEELKAEGYKQNVDGEWYKMNLFGAVDLYTGEDSDLYTYINDKKQRQAIGVENMMKTSYATSANGIGVPSSGVNTYEKLGYHTLTEEEIGAFNYLYHQDRKNGTNTAEEYLRNISPLLQQRAMELEAKTYAKISKEAPVVMSGISLGTNLANALMFPAKVAATATGMYEDMPMLDTYGNRTQAIRGAVSEDMGTLGNLAYNATMSIGDMGVAMLAGGGNAKVVQAIMSSSAGSSTISQAKKNGASDGKALVLGLGSAAIEWATEKYSVEAILKKPESILGYLGTNTFTEATEEGVSNVSNIALDAIVSEVFGERNEIEQRIDYLVLYEGKSEEEALHIAFTEKLQNLGEDVLIGGLTGFGMSSAVATPVAVQRGVDHVRNKPTQEGNTPSNTTVSEKNSTIPTQQTTAPDTLEQAAMDVVSRRNEQSGTPSQIAEAKSINSVAISVEEAQQASGYGENGSKLLANAVNSTTEKSFSQVKGDIHNAYMAGMSNKNIRYNDPLKQEAYNAGKQDRIMQDAAYKEKVKTPTIYKGAFTENENTKNFTESERTMISTVAKSFGMDVSVVDKIIANVVNGKVYEANAEHQDGKMRISSNTDKVISELVLHEGGHRMRQLAPTEFGVLMDALYERADGRSIDLGISHGLRFDDIKSQHDKAGISLDTSGYIEEVAVRELETIFSSAEEFNKWYSEISGNQQTKTAWQKFIDFVAELIEDVKKAIANAKLSKEERVEAKKSLNELERIKELYANAYKAAENAVAERGNTQSQSVEKNTASADGVVNFSLKNKNLNINSRIPYVVLKDYTNVANNDYSALRTLEGKVKSLKRGTYQNNATGYSADINADTIRKAIYPTHNNFNPFKDAHIHNLNAITKLPELFKNAVYVDSKSPQKTKNQNKAIKEYHHFVAPIFMDNGEYRALITAREKVNSNTLYVLRVEVLPTQKRHTLSATQQNAGGSQWLSVPSDISIPELVNNVKIKNYDTNIEDTYTGADIQFSLKEIDKEYLDLAKDPEKNEARLRELVNEAATRAGYTDDTSWRMGHTAPNSRDDVSLDKLKESGLIPNDFWEHPEWYTYSAEERESYYKVKKAIEIQEKRDAEGITRPAMMWVYRAVDKTKNRREDYFRNGDWVTPSYDYAVQEGKQNPEGYRIIKHSVSIKDLYWDGNSIAELGYDDGNTYAYADTLNNRKKLDLVTYYPDGDIIPLSKRFNRRDSDVNFSLKDTELVDAINQSMTMEQAKDMIQRAFVLGGIKEWFDGEYQNGDEWLKGQGAAEVALIVDNEYTLQQKFLDKVQGVLNGDFYAEDIIEAYANGTLTGKVKQNVVKRLDTSKQTNATDTRVFAPKDIKNAQERYKVALERVTNSNREKVYQARADIIMFAHNRGAAEALGLTQSELNKKLATWARYTARAKEVSMRINKDVALFNKWTGIENSNVLNRATVSQTELDNLVNEIKGDSNGWQRSYIMRTMLALDTHIDYSELNFEFVGTPKTAMGKSVNGLYDNSKRKITVKYNAPHTVSHEMGHFLDYQWARDFGLKSSALTDGFGRDKQTDADVKQFLTNFDEFIEQIENSADLRSEYTMDRKEVFARFVSKFVQWVDLVSNGQRSYAQEYLSYNDKFTTSQYVEFVRLLQEKAMLDSKRFENKSFSLKDTTTNSIEDIKTKYADKTDHLYIYEKKNAISIDNIVVKKEYRNKGIGTAILNDVIEYADQVQKTITLTPTSEFGTKERLKKWYKANGFVENKGRHTDFTISDTMYRLPLSKSFSLKGTDINTKDRKQLLDIIEHLKGEFELTKLAKADPKKLSKMTKDILKEYSSQADFDETYKAIDELYQYMANGEEGHPAVWEDVYNRAYDIAQEIVSNALVVDDYMYQEYKSLRNYLRNTPMKFYSGYDSSPIAYENFNEFRKSNFGRLKFTKDGLSIDSVYQELAGLYPEFFDTERDNNTSDQLERIVEVLDEIQPTEINPYDREIQQASMYLANDLTSRFFDIPQAKPTFADKAERRVIDARIAGAKKVDAVRQQKDEKIKKLIETQRAKTKKQLDKLRQQRDDRVKKEQAKRRDAISKMGENQKAKVLRAQIMRHAGDLSKKLVNPTDNQHIPQELQGAVAKLLECINLESNYTYDTESHSYKKNDEGLPSRRTQAFNELRDLYSKIADTVVVDPDLMGEGGILSDVISLADKRIADMNSSELNTVWQALRAVEASVNTANKMFSQGKFETILGFAEALREDNAGKKEKTEFKGLLGKGKKLAGLDMLTPETYFHYLGSAGDSIFRMMRDAQDKHISIMKEVADFTHKTLKDVDVNSLEKTLHTVKLGGEDVKLSTAQLMELYVLMKREQAVDHILLGGILPDVTEGKGLKLNTKAKPTRNISVAEISTALSKLTEEQKKVADKLQHYVSTVLSAYGNEASMKVYNYEKFLEKNYWTIRTNRQEINSEVGKDTSVTSVANKGMAKGTVPHANTSVRIGSIFDTFSAHSSDMATYAAWLGTSEDVNRIRNFVFWEDGARVGTVKGIIDTVHGMHGSDYLQKLLTDVAIGVKGTDNMNPFDKLIGNYKAASVGANLRVVIQQPTALLRALDMIDAHYLAEGAVRPLKGWEKAKKYAPIAQWKDWGHFDINTGRQMKDVLFDNASLLEKTKQVGMWGASVADSLAWGQLWNAVEAETKAKHKELGIGTEEYYEAVAKRFTEIVDHTQVVDGILQRSQIMRSPDALTKMATSFMGEPTKQYNMAVAAAYDAINAKGDTKKKAVARLGRTAASLAVAGIINACAQSIIDAMRDDDKEKDYWEKWLSAFKGDEDDKWFQKFGNIGDTANPLNYVPFAKDIISVWAGYDVKRMDMESISKTSNAVANMYKAVTGTGKYTIAEASAQLFAEIARLYGLPVANVKRDIKSLVTAVAQETDSYYLQYRMEKAMLKINYAGNGKNFIDILFNAYNNDNEAYKKIYYDMIESGYEADKIKSGMETRMKKAEGVEKTSELTKRYMTPTTEKKYDSSLKQIKSSQVWQSATPEQRQGAKADLYKFLTSDSEDIEKARAEAREYGIDETEYTLWQLAIEMADQPKGEKGSGSYDSKEKAEAINSLNLGNEEIAYFYGKGLDEYAKEELNETLNAGIDLQEYVNFKAATSEMKADKNANGKSIPNSKKRKVVNYLNNANLTNEEWNYFYYEIMNYKK